MHVAYFLSIPLTHVHMLQGRGIVDVQFPWFFVINMDLGFGSSQFGDVCGLPTYLAVRSLFRCEVLDWMYTYYRKMSYTISRHWKEKCILTYVSSTYLSNRWPVYATQPGNNPPHAI